MRQHKICQENQDIWFKDSEHLFFLMNLETCWILIKYFASKILYWQPAPCLLSWPQPPPPASPAWGQTEAGEQGWGVTQDSGQSQHFKVEDL